MSAREIRKVRHPDTGETGWMATYGEPGFGGVRTSVFTTRDAARDADVSDDVGPKVIARHVDPRDWDAA